jgi:Zn-dependent protease with chaperone function
MTDPPVAPGSPAAPEPWASVPGPADRESFFAAQRRHRRASRWYSALGALTALMLAVAASLVLSPLVIVLAVLVVRLLALVLPVPAIVWQAFHPLLTMYERLKSVLQDVRLSPAEAVPALESLGVLLIPGVVAIVLLWLGVRTLFFRAGVGGLVLTLGARPPDANDLEEHRLVNVVHEMAIAAGLPPPRVMVLDGEVANAAAIGASPREATVVVSRRLLAELDRDETQGILGHLIASVGNGDLRILLTFLSVAQTFGLLMALVDAPLSRRARATIGQLLRLALFGWMRRGRMGPLADLVGTMLTGRLEPEAVDDTLQPLADTERPSAGIVSRAFAFVRFVLLLPVILLSLEAKLLLLLTTLFVVGPITWSTLRRRRYLADATAVQLTRNPDGLAGALIALAHAGGDTAGGPWAQPLFVVGGAASRATGRGDRTPLFLLGAQPPLRGRLARLAALGASIRPEAASAPPDVPAAAAPTASAAASSTALTSSAAASSRALTLLIAVPLVGLVLLVVGALVFYGAAFVLYLFAVGVVGALLVIAGIHVVAMELVVRLLSSGG